jgi:genome maintenance exonuclease 1
MDQIRSGAIVVAYSDGFPAHVHVMDKKLCEEYWKKWLERLHMYWQKIKSAK